MSALSVLKHAKGSLNGALAAAARELPRHLPGYRRNRILLFCDKIQYAEHIADYLDALEDRDRRRLYLYADPSVPDADRLAEKYSCKRVSRRSLPFRCFDLVVTPDTYTRGWHSDSTKVLYINHGEHIVGRNNGENTYTYTEMYGHTRPDIICEPSSRIAEAVAAASPELAKRVRCVGWKFYEKQNAALEKRAEYRRQMGFTDTDTVLFVVTTWGPESLAVHYGTAIYDAIAALSGTYKVIVSLHPLVKQSRIAGAISEKIEMLRGLGCMIREPGTDWTPCMVAADIVFSDFSTLTETAVSMRKRLILSEYPEGTVWKESAIARIKPLLPVVHTPEELADRVKQALESDMPAEVLAIANETAVTHEEYKHRINDITKELLNR